MRRLVWVKTRTVPYGITMSIRRNSGFEHISTSPGPSLHSVAAFALWELLHDSMLWSSHPVPARAQCLFKGSASLRGYRNSPSAVDPLVIG